MDLKVGGYYSRRTLVKYLIVIIIILLALFIIYFYIYKDYLFIFAEKCQDSDCFNKCLVKCKRARWVNDASEATWLYTIQGKSEENCEIEVELRVVKEGELDIGEAEGKSMKCYIPLGVMASPGKDLARCTGPLKEDLQDLIIKKMHSYILKNLGEISEELTKVL